MPSYTFVSTANAFVLRGAVPVFVDVRPETLCIDERLIEAAITPRTRVICVVHYAGVPCEMDAIMDVAQRHNLVVIEDAAQAYLSQYKGRFLGSIGHLGCFSFHYTKNVIAGEGGALCINDARFTHRAHVVWEKGTNRFDFLQGKVDKYCWVDIGSSFVPNECMSAFLCAQLDEGARINAKRLRICNVYRELLEPLAQRAGITMLPSAPEGNGHLFWMLFASEAERVAFQKALAASQVQSFSHYLALHASPAGQQYGRTAEGAALPHTDRASVCLARLPLWNAMSWQHVYKVVAAVHAALGASGNEAQLRDQVRERFLPEDEN